MAVTRADIEKGLACFTIAQDEDIGLRMWLAHYKKYAPTAQLYILDHNTRGSYREWLKVAVNNYDAVVVPVNHAYSFDYAWLTATVEKFMQFLFASHDVVCFSEIDELAFPTTGTIEDFINSHDSVFFRCGGYGVVHNHPVEPDLNWHEPILQQRENWYKTTRYSKICLARRPVFFKYGFHVAHNVPEALPMEKDLLLLHTHQIDYKTALRRHQNNAGRFWSPQFRLNAEALHQRLDNPPALQKYLLCDLDSPHDYAKLEPIPAEYKKRYTACVPAA